MAGIHPGRLRIAVATNVRPAVLRAYLAPLASLDEVAEVAVVRDLDDLPVITKVRAVVPPSWWPRTLITKIPMRRLLQWRTGRLWRPDVVMLMHWFPDGPAIVRWARRLGVPAVVHIIGGRAEVVDGGRRAALSKLPAWVKASLQHYALHQLQRSAVVTVTGEETRAWYAARLNTKVVVLRAAIPDPSSGAAAGVGRDIDVMFIGRADRDKRVDRLFRVASIVAASRPQLTVAVVGVDEAEVAPAADYQLARRLLGERLILTRHVPSVDEHLRRTRVLVVPSDTEGRTLAALEAFVGGAAVVATQVGDLQEVVERSGGGITVPLNDDESALCESLAFAVHGLLDDEPRRAAAAERGHGFVRQAHSFDRSRADWREILQAARLVTRP